MRDGKIRRFKPRSNRYHSRRHNAGMKSNNGVYQLNSQKNNNGIQIRKVQRRIPRALQRDYPQFAEAVFPDKIKPNAGLD